MYCPRRQRLFQGWDSASIDPTADFYSGIEFPGIYIQLNFLSEAECQEAMKGIDELPWDISQSGRRKQNYGPKTNFKKRKLKSGTFRGFPELSQFIQKRLKDVPLLAGYQTIEQCSLEYTPETGASIEPHIDDCWVWGERVVTVNCLGDSVLTLTRYHGDASKYNLDCVESYKESLISTKIPLDTKSLPEDVVVRVPMPQGSLIVMYGEPRYKWEHCVLREDIRSRRVCIAYRELTANYLPGGVDHEEAKEVLEKAQQFWNHTI